MEVISETMRRPTALQMGFLGRHLVVRVSLEFSNGEVGFKTGTFVCLSWCTLEQLHVRTGGLRLVPKCQALQPRPECPAPGHELRKQLTPRNSRNVPAKIRCDIEAISN